MRLWKKWKCFETNRNHQQKKPQRETNKKSIIVALAIDKAFNQLCEPQIGCTMSCALSLVNL